MKKKELNEPVSNSAEKSPCKSPSSFIIHHSSLIIGILSLPVIEKKVIIFYSASIIPQFLRRRYEINDETRKPIPRAMVTIPRAWKILISSVSFDRIGPIIIKAMPKMEKMTPFEIEEMSFSFGSMPSIVRKLMNLLPPSL
jgi:hypothetical protein